jgi:hypothetical protein
MKRCLAVLFFLLLARPMAQATTVMPMFLDDLTAASQTVVYGKVIASRTEWDEGHNWIYTIYTVVPWEYLKGQLGPSFELREPGGERDGMGTRVAGVPEFQPGQEAVLFVWTDPKGRHQVSGFEQGAVAITTEAATGAKLASRTIPLGTARAGDRPAPAQLSIQPPPSSRALPQLFQQIRSSVAKSRQASAGE